MSTYRISQLAERCGIPATTLRFYEVGVLAFVSGMVLSSMSGLGRCGAGRFGCFYGVLRSGGRALVLDKQ
ncbi:MerR family transcriptional regulator [Streptomyces sp. NPDC002540]